MCNHVLYFSVSQRPALIWLVQTFHSKHSQPHSPCLERLCQHTIKMKSCRLTSKHVQCIQKPRAFESVFYTSENRMFEGFLCTSIALCSRCPWYCQHCRRGTKAPRPVSQQPALFLASLLTWTRPSCLPQLEHWTLRMTSLLLTTGAMTLPQNNRHDAKWKITKKGDTNKHIYIYDVTKWAIDQ